MARSTPPPHESPHPEPDLVDLAWQSLRAPLTSFIGREQEVAAVVNLLVRPGVRLVTLTGPGGVGKTRLALRAAELVAGHFARGFEVIDLTPIREPELVLRIIAQALGIRAQTSLLLVLDNFEQVIEAAPGITELLTACPRITILATSRERLRIGGEHVVPVPPMDLAGEVDNANPLRSEAVALFHERSRAVAPDFSVSSDDAFAIVEICRTLDGLPLAIELAAAHSGVLTATMLLERLQPRLPMLTAGARDAPARQQTMRDTIAWSYNLLSPDEQADFRSLAVFVGGFTLEAAEWVLREGSEITGQPSESSSDTFDRINRLAEKGLVQLRKESVGGVRFLLLETIREYGLEQLEASVELFGIHQRHATWCLDLATRAEEVVRRLPRPHEFARIEAELPNIRTALAWLDETGQSAPLLQLADVLEGFWYLKHLLPEFHYWQERALAQSPEQTRLRARVLILAGNFAEHLGDHQMAQQRYQEGMALARQLEDLWTEALGHMVIGVGAEDRGDYDLAESHIAAALSFYDRTTESWPPIVLTFHLGVVAYGRGNLEQAREFLHATIAAGKAIGDTATYDWCQDYLALIYIKQRNFPLAAAVLRDQLTQRSVAGPFLNWGRTLATLAVLGAASNQAAPATRILAAVMSNGRSSVNDLPERADFEWAAEWSRKSLGEAAFAGVWATGETMSVEAIDADMRAILARFETEPHQQLGAALLTRRESDVLKLVVEGLSNTQIGERLFISHRTAQTHVTNILGKLGVTTRTEAAAKAVRDGLV